MTGEAPPLTAVPSEGSLHAPGSWRRGCATLAHGLAGALGGGGMLSMADLALFAELDRKSVV